VKNIWANCVPPSNWYCLLSLCFMHYFSNFSSYLRQYTFSSIDYVFFNIYLFKVSSKSTSYLVFLGLIEYRFIFYFLEYRFPTLVRLFCARFKYNKRVTTAMLFFCFCADFLFHKSTFFYLMRSIFLSSVLKATSLCHWLSFGQGNK